MEIIIRMISINYKKTFVLIAIGTVMLMTMISCGKKKKLTYGDTEGVVSGSITFNDEGAKFELENVKAPAGTDIDYTSGIITSGEEEDYSVEVNASNVRYDKPGTYTANYTVKSGNRTYTDNIKVTITDNANSSNENNYSDVEESGGDYLEQTNGQQNEVPQENSQNNSENPQNNAETNNQPARETEKKVLVTDGESVTYKNKNIPNAVIELLSGDVVTISCSTNKYIVSTRTEESEQQKNGHKYKITKLIVTFNTGKEQTLETIEKKID